MTIPLISRYSATLTAQPPYDESAVQSIQVQRRIWGDIQIDWIPSVTCEVKIIRRLFDYAQNLTDGEVIFSGIGSAGRFVDENIEAFVTYYYVLYYLDVFGEWLTKPSLKGHAWTFGRKYDPDVNPDTFDHPGKIADLFPTMYNLQDTPDDDPRKLNSLTDIVQSLIYAEMEGLAEFLPQTYDVDVAPGMYLGMLAKEIGLEPNEDLPYMQQREEIKNATQFYVTKGRADSIELFSTAIMGTAVQVDPWVKNVLMSNFVERKSVNFEDLGETSGYRLPGDVVQNSLDFTTSGWYNTVNFGIFVNINPLWGVTMEATQKLQRSANKYSPVSTESNIVLLDSPYLETVVVSDTAIPPRTELYDNTREDTVVVSESSFDVLNPSDVELVNNILISNVKIRKSNSLGSLSFHHLVIESFWDEITHL